MTASAEIERAFKNIRVHSGPDGVAPHKPLLILLMLRRCYDGAPRLVSFAEVDKQLARLLREFHPQGSSHLNTHYPFGKLENDGLWEIKRSNELKRTSAGHLLRGQLLAENVQAGFEPRIFHQLATNKTLIIDVAAAVAETFFDSDEAHAILAQLGLFGAETYSADAVPVANQTEQHLPTDQAP